MGAGGSATRRHAAGCSGRLPRVCAGQHAPLLAVPRPTRPSPPLPLPPPHAPPARPAADKYGTSVASLIDWNPDLEKNPGLLNLGYQLVVQPDCTV